MSLFTIQTAALEDMVGRVFALARIGRRENLVALSTGGLQALPAADGSGDGNGILQLRQIHFSPLKLLTSQ